MALLTRTQYTVEEYLQKERTAEYKNEFAEGEIIPMAGGSARHSLIGGNIVRHLGELLDDTPCRVYTSDMRIRIPETNLFTYPDAAVVCEEPIFQDELEDVLLNPLVIVEVLSPSTERYDRGRKFDQYKQISSFQEYLLIAQDEPRITIHRRTPEGDWIPTEVQGFGSEVTLTTLDCVLSLARVYHKVTFPNSD